MASWSTTIGGLSTIPTVSPSGLAPTDHHGLPSGRELPHDGRSHDAGHSRQPQEECADGKGTEHPQHADCGVLDLGSYMVPTGVQAGTGTKVPMSPTSSATYAYHLILGLL